MADHEVFKEFQRFAKAGNLCPKCAPSVIGVHDVWFRGYDGAKETIPQELRLLSMAYLDAYATAILACCPRLLPVTNLHLVCIYYPPSDRYPRSGAFWLGCENEYANISEFTAWDECRALFPAFSALVDAKQISTRNISSCNLAKPTNETATIELEVPYPGYYRGLVDPQQHLVFELMCEVTDEMRRKASVAMNFAQGQDLPTTLFQRAPRDC